MTAMFQDREFKALANNSVNAYLAPLLCALDAPSKVIECSSLIRCGMGCVQETISISCSHFNVKRNADATLQVGNSMGGAKMSCELYFFNPSITVQSQDVSITRSDYTHVPFTRLLEYLYNVVLLTNNFVSLSY